MGIGKEERGEGRRQGRLEEGTEREKARCKVMAERLGCWSLGLDLNRSGAQ